VLRQALGYDLMLGAAAVPKGYVISRFLAKLVHHQAIVDQILQRSAVTMLPLMLPFGKHLVGDRQDMILSRLQSSAA
jgi:hypothetical protein